MCMYAFVHACARWARRVCNTVGATSPSIVASCRLYVVAVTINSHSIVHDPGRNASQKIIAKTKPRDDYDPHPLGNTRTGLGGYIHLYDTRSRGVNRTTTTIGVLVSVTRVPSCSRNAHAVLENGSNDTHTMCSRPPWACMPLGDDYT